MMRKQQQHRYYCSFMAGKDGKVRNGEVLDPARRSVESTPQSSRRWEHQCVLCFLLGFDYDYNKIYTKRSVVSSLKILGIIPRLQYSNFPIRDVNNLLGKIQGFYRGEL